MTNTRTFRLIRVIFLALLATVASVAPLSAADYTIYTGRFTLPFEAKWGTATLPPGEYTFTLNQATVEGSLKVTSHDLKSTVFVHVQGVLERDFTGQSALIMVRSGGKYKVRALHATEIGKVLTFGTSQAERQMLAQGPELIQRIPVLIAHNK